MAPSLRAAAAACLLASCGAETLMKYVLVPGFDSDDAPMFSRWGVPLHWDSTLNETELQTKARDFATTYHLRQTHACGNDVNCITDALVERMAAATASCDADWPERLADVVQRLSKASAGYEAFGDIAIVLSGSTDKLASTLESLYERVVQPSGAMVFAVLSGGQALPEATQKALRALPFVGAVEFAGNDTDAVRRDHAEHYPYPARRKKEPEPHVNLLYMWKGIRDANALREAYEEATGTTFKVAARVRTDMEFDRDHNLERYLDLQKFALYVPRCVEIKFYGTFVLNRRVVLHALDGVAMRLISTQVPRCGHAIVNAAAFLTWPPGYRGVNDQFFVAQGDTFGRVARLYEYIPSLYADAQCTFHPEHLLGYAAVAALRLELRYYEAPPPDPAALPEPVPGFASASGREEAPCDFAAAGYHIRRHSEREGAWL
jgi:hypothetical protein